MSTQKDTKTPNTKGEKSGNITAYSKSKLSGKPICRKTIKPIKQQLKANGKTIEESLLDLPRFTLYFILHGKVIQQYLDLFAINSGCAPLTVDDVRKVIADNRLGEQIDIEKYDDKFVFTNPGLLRLPVEQIYAGEETRARNQRIQNMFRMIGFGENLGSGFPLILSAWNEKHWLKPELIEQRELMQVKLVLSIETKDVVKELPDVVKELPDDLLSQLSDRQVEILNLIDADSTISAKAISEKTSEKTSEKDSVTDRTIETDIAKLKKLDILIREGGRKDGEWILTELGLAVLEASKKQQEK